MSVDSAARRPYPAAFHLGPGHLIAFIDAFGRGCVGQPAREALLDLPSAAFELMDLVYQRGAALACRIETPAGERRLVVAARSDPETGETYGVISHLRPI
jgi:hypothetical protein